MLADRLLRRLHERWHPGGLLFHGLGKWYPGEELPRWALSCWFRKDGVPLWNDPSLFAASDHDHGHDVALAERFARRSTAKLGLERHGLMPAYEDVWYYLWRERRLPQNVNPLDARLGDRGESRAAGPRVSRGARQRGRLGSAAPARRRLGLGTVVLARRALLPVARRFTDGASAPARFTALDRRRRRRARECARSVRRAACAAGAVQFSAASPGAHRSNASHASTPASAANTSTEKRGTFDVPALHESASGIVRTALCIEPRGGTLRVFMPPLQALEAYVELIAAIEATTAELGCKVQIEGYAPPQDSRIGRFSLSADPG